MPFWQIGRRPIRLNKYECLDTFLPKVPRRIANCLNKFRAPLPGLQFTSNYRQGIYRPEIRRYDRSNLGRDTVDASE